MWIPRHWARATDRGRTCLGWSDSSASEAEGKARERLARLLALGDRGASGEWDYYPATPLKEEILETRRLPGVTAIVTRNRAGALVLNTDQIAFVDVDLPAKTGSLLGAIGGLFRRSRAPDEAVGAALARVEAWAGEERARLRAYRTARGLRLLRMDAPLDPAGEECLRMFTALGADPQYARLCSIQKSFRARLTPKPRRVECGDAPGSHPRTDAAIQAAFREWLARYERACERYAVCSFIGEYGPGTASAPAQAIAALHDPRTVRAEGKLA